MAIFIHEEEDFERGTTVSSRIRLTNQDGDYVEADTTLDFDQDENVEDVTMEVIDPETDQVKRQEEFMDDLNDDNGERYYLDSWQTSESLEPKEYYMVHRATIDGEPFKLTRIVDIVKAKDNC